MTAQDDPMRMEWRVTGMDCGACAGKVRGAVARLPGVGEVDVAFMAERLRLTLEPGATSPERIEAAVRALGFGIAPKGAAPERPKPAFSLPGDAPRPALETGVQAGAEAAPRPAAGVPRRAAKRLGLHDFPKARLVIGTGLLLASAWGAGLLLSAEIAAPLFVFATLLGLLPVARRALATARAGMPFTIETLMTVAAAGALLIGEAEEAALVVFLFAVGEALEGLAAERAREGIRALSRLLPRTALLEVGGRLREVPAESLAVGATVLLRPGDRAPCDGAVIEGVSGVDESPVTGESAPRPKAPGAEVFAGSVNGEGALRLRVTRAAEDNTIARIIRLVEEAESARAPTERFIDRFSRIYMPAVVCAALLVASVPPLALGLPWGEWVYRALALLLIGCPCALVISVPAAIASALSAGARHGILMKGGAVIEAVAGVTHVAFDKTGTLTEGRPRVTQVLPLSGDVAALLAAAAGVEAGASHPLARAIRERAEAEGVAPAPAAGARALPGRGAEAVIAGATVAVGSPRLAEERGALAPALRDRIAALEAEGATVAVVLREGAPLGLLALRDAPRPEAAEAVRRLARLGVAPVMLTGDNARTAAAVAGELGLAHRAGLLPEDKVAEIRALAARARVMMVGDGINDAPALAAAHVGLAMGSGTEVALETADAALLRDRTTDVAATIRLARATMANIRQNIALALGLKAVFLATTLFGITGLWIAILADTGATVLVTLNALRLLAFQPAEPDAAGPGGRRTSPAPRPAAAV